jgi:uncharacterized protein
MHLTLHVTGRCNLRCRYCYAAKSPQDMSFETATAAIALAARDTQAKTPGGSVGVAFFGGEPLLRRGLLARVVRHCRQVEAETGQSFHFKVTTNGTHLDEAFLTDPDTAPIFIGLSHDGVREAHDAMRVDAAGQGSFARLDPVVDLVLRHRPHTPAMLVVTPETVRHYADSVAYLHRRGFRYLICSLHYAAPWSRRALAELRRQYQRLADWYYQQTLAEAKFYFSPFEVKIASHVHPGSCRADRCELGRDQISVAPGGKLYPCVQFVGDDAFCIGNVQAGLDEEARRRLYLVNAEEKSTCTACAIRERCNHYCGCLNRQATGRLDTVSPVLCAHERIVLPIADRLAARLYRERSALFLQKHYNELYPVVSLVEDTVAGV